MFIKTYGLLILKQGHKTSKNYRVWNFDFTSKLLLLLLTSSFLYTGIYKKNHITVCGEKNATVKHVEDRYAEFLPESVAGVINPRHGGSWIWLYRWPLESVGIGSYSR